MTTRPIILSSIAPGSSSGGDIVGPGTATVTPRELERSTGRDRAAA